MKKYILISYLFASSIVYAQNYQPFPKENARWAYYFEQEGFDYWTLYYLTGDTTINQTTYHKIKGKIWEEPNSSPTIFYDDMYFREENKRIYFRNTLVKDEEVLTYDFNLTVGDTFNLKTFDTLVVKRDYVNNGQRHLYLECLNKDYLGIKIFDIWIEGIGSQNYLLKPSLFSSLRCYESDNKPSATCDYIDKILDIKELNNVQPNDFIYPNPTFDRLNFQNEKSKYKVYKILNINGEVLKTEAIVNKYIDVSNFKEGLYLLQLIGVDITTNFKFHKTTATK